MKLTVKKTVNVDGWHLKAFLGDITRWWEEDPFEFNGKEYTNIDEFEQDYPDLVGIQPPYYSSDPKEGTKTIKLYIDICTGEVPNWPGNVDFDFNNYKLVDTGRYEIRDRLGELVAGHTGYVPHCLSIDDCGYGDYLQFHIENGHIVDWDFSQEDYDEIEEEQ